MAVQELIVFSRPVTAAWSTFCQADIAKGAERSLLKGEPGLCMPQADQAKRFSLPAAAWKRVKRDMDSKRNPVYDSEDELDRGPLELGER